MTPWPPHLLYYHKLADNIKRSGVDYSDYLGMSFFGAWLINAYNVLDLLCTICNASVTTWRIKIINPIAVYVSKIIQENSDAIMLIMGQANTGCIIVLSLSLLRIALLIS